jgi:hypothetical protein
MIMKKIQNLVIGQKLFKYAKPYILKYEVVGIREYKDGNQYELRCLSCTHGENCLVLIGGRPKLVFIEVLNDEYGKEDYWHNDSTYFWPTEREAKLEALKRSLEFHKDQIKEKKESLVCWEISLKEKMIAIELLQKEIKELGIDEE